MIPPKTLHSLVLPLLLILPVFLVRAADTKQVQNAEPAICIDTRDFTYIDHDSGRRDAQLLASLLVSRERVILEVAVSAAAPGLAPLPGFPHTNDSNLITAEELQMLTNGQRRIVGSSRNSDGHEIQGDVLGNSLGVTSMSSAAPFDRTRSTCTNSSPPPGCVSHHSDSRRR